MSSRDGRFLLLYNEFRDTIRLIERPGPLLVDRSVSSMLSALTMVEITVHPRLRGFREVTDTHIHALAVAREQTVRAAIFEWELRGFDPPHGGVAARRKGERQGREIAWMLRCLTTGEPNEAQPREDEAAEPPSARPTPQALAAPREKLSIEAHKDCPVCYSETHELVVTECGHVFCNGCICAWLRSHHSCPFCRVALHENQLIGPVAASERESSDNRDGTEGDLQG